MSFTYTPGEVGAKGDTSNLADPLRYRGATDEDRVEAERRYHLALTWKPPAGHATWCEVQLPPVWRHSHVGSTPMASRGGCTCSRSKVARSVRKLNAKEERPTTIAA
jgi:hypothetical protein